MGCGCGGKKARVKRAPSLGSLLGDPYLSGLAGLGDDSFAAKLLTREPYVTIGRLVKTSGDARVALGKAAELFRRGFEKAEDVSILAGARDQARSLLDQGNNYAMKTYAELPSGNVALDTKTKAKVVEALKESVDDLNGVNELLSIQLDLMGALQAGLGNVLGIPNALVQGVLPGIAWWQIALGAGVIFGGIVAARRLVR